MTIPEKKPWYDIVSSLTPLIVGIGVTGVGGFFTANFNDRQLQLNQLAALEKFRPALGSENAAEREFAYTSFAVLGYEALALRIMKVKNDSAGRSVALDIQKTGSTPSAKAEATATLSQLPVQVFGHIGAESARSMADGVMSTLRLSGYIPVGVENITGKAIVPTTTEVRYFNDEDKNHADAIALVLRDKGLASAEAKRVAIPAVTVKRGTIEVWFGANGN